MASTNNSLNNNSKTSIANAIQTFVVSNSDNSGTSSAKMQISVGGATTTGDPKSSFIVTSGATWSMGIDNSASDSLVICPSATLGTNNSHVIQTNGFNRLPKQPAVLGILTADSLNRTGSGTIWQVGSPLNTFTLVFNIGSNISSGVFTAPVTGTYMFTGSITLTGCTINNGISLQFSTSNRNAVKRLNRTASSADNCANMSYLGDMDLNDTASFNIGGFGEASSTDDLVGGTATAVTYFTVYLVG